MAKLLLGISGRVEEGETLSAVVFNPATQSASLTGFSLQWQYGAGATWTNVGAPNSLTLVIPAGAAALNRSYRLVANPTEAANEASQSEATAAAVVDKGQSRAPTLGDVAGTITTSEGAAPALIDGAVSFDDADNANYGGGSLTITGPADGTALGVRSGGAGASKINYNPDTQEVSWSPKVNQSVVIGQFHALVSLDGVAKGRIQFNSNATKAAVDRLIESLEWSNADDSPDASRLFTLQVIDGTGGSVQRALIAHVTPVNDAPVALSIAATVQEDGPTVMLTPAFTDPDGADSHSFTVATAGTVGQVTVAGGAFHYSPGAAFHHLAQGQTATDSFQYTVRDAGGLASTQTATVTVVGSNDTASLTGATATVTEDSVPAGGTVVASGQLTITDADAGQSAVVAQNGVAGAFMTGGRFSIDAAGRWVYTVPNADLQLLTPSFERHESFRVTSVDGSASAFVSIRHTGVNDAPMVDETQSDLAAAVTARSGPYSFPVDAWGFLRATDPDTLSLLTWSVANGQGSWGSFSVSHGSWNYSLSNELARPLAAGQTATDSFQVVVRDPEGATDSATVTITVTGANDTPVIGAGSTVDGTVREAGAGDIGVASATGTLVATDVDTGDALGWSSTGTGRYGSFSLHASTGVWRYDLDNGDPDTQALPAGADVVEVFTAWVTDGQGLSASRTVQVHVLGANDAPVIGAGTTTTGSVREAGVSAGAADPGTPTASGTLAATDPDTGSALTWSSAGAATYGNFTVDSAAGNWTYTLDNTRPATNALAAGATVTETLQLTVADASGATDTRTLTIQVTGTNDAPVLIGGDTTGTVNESAPDGRLLLDHAIAGGVYDIAVDAQGRLVIIGQHDDPFGRGLWRLNRDGTTDASFGEGGVRYITQGTAFEQVALDAAGGHVIAGIQSNPQDGHWDFAVARYTANGTLDEGFGSNGMRLIDFAGATDRGIL